MKTFIHNLHQRFHNFRLSLKPLGFRKRDPLKGTDNRHYESRVSEARQVDAAGPALQRSSDLEAKPRSGALDFEGKPESLAEAVEMFRIRAPEGNRVGSDCIASMERKDGSKLRIFRDGTAEHCVPLSL